MKKLLLGGILFCLLSHSSPGQSVVFFFNGDEKDQRLFFESGDTVLTVKFQPGKHVANMKYQFGTISLKSYRKVPGRELSNPEEHSIEVNTRAEKPSVNIDLRKYIKENTNLLVVTVSAVYQFGSQGRRETVEMPRRGSLYREFIRSATINQQ